MRSRAGKAWSLGVAGVAGLLAAWLLAAPRRGHSIEEPARAAGVLEAGLAAGPSLRAGPRAEAPLAREAPKSPLSSDAPTAIDALINRLRIALEGRDRTAVSRAITALSRAICGDRARAKYALDRALAHGSEGDEPGDRTDVLPTRTSGAIGHALGRCEDPETLSLLVAALRNPETNPAMRTSLVLSLGQRRQADLTERGGRGIGKGDANVDSAIQEDFVRDALVETLETEARLRGRGMAAARTAAERKAAGIAFIQTEELLSNCLLVLGPCAVNDAALLAKLIAVGRLRTDLMSTVLTGLSLLEDAASGRQLALTLLSEESWDEHTVRTAFGVLVRADPDRAMEYLLEAFADGATSPARRVTLMTALGDAHRAPRQLALLERVVAAMEPWITRVPTIVQTPATVHSVEQRLDTRAVWMGLQFNLLAVPELQSVPFLREAAKRAIALWLAGEGELAVLGSAVLLRYASMGLAEADVADAIWRLAGMGVQAERLRSALAVIEAAYPLPSSELRAAIEALRAASAR